VSAPTDLEQMVHDLRGLVGSYEQQARQLLKTWQPRGSNPRPPSAEVAVPEIVQRALDETWPCEKHRDCKNGEHHYGWDGDQCPATYRDDALDFLKLVLTPMTYASRDSADRVLVTLGEWVIELDAARERADYDPTPRELGDTTGDGTDAAHRESEARKLK
jgi:hypothetical protein